jgi:hypothetical protein
MKKLILALAIATVGPLAANAATVTLARADSVPGVHNTQTTAPSGYAQTADNTASAGRVTFSSGHPQQPLYGAGEAG